MPKIGIELCTAVKLTARARERHAKYVRTSEAVSRPAHEAPLLSFVIVLASNLLPRLFQLFVFFVTLWLAAQPGRAASSPTGPLGSVDLKLIEALTFGVNESTAAEFQALGSDHWLEAQLRPGLTDRLPSRVRAMIDVLPVSTVRADPIAISLAAQARAANQIQDVEQKKAAQQLYQQNLNDVAKQAATRSLLRAIYSPDQLHEKMTWFWFNHFNVYQNKSDIRAFIGDYEDRAIRPHALGRFRDLLGATMRHPAMLRYLDNAENARGHINENYAREIMELHTLGVNSGYTQQDIQELARILTGVGINLNPHDPKLPSGAQNDYIRVGLFEFNPNRHDYSVKRFLGHTIEGRGFAEVEQALDILARHPATAKHVCWRLATYFISDEPPAELVHRMAQTFDKTDGDIASILKVMITSPEFRTGPKLKMKDSMQFVISALRLAYDSKVLLNIAPIQGWLGRLGEGLYSHETPDGYPLTSAAWSGPGQLAVRFEIARQIGSNSAGLFKNPTAGSVDLPAFPQIANALYFNSLQKTLSASTRAALDEATSAQDWNTLFLSSPEFMR